MCIRDSLEEHLLTGAGAEFARLHLALDDERFHTEELALTAVSYTHLRAHETVLDIVCRILLEK